MTLAEELIKLAESGLYDAEVSRKFIQRVPLGRLTKDENLQSHFSVHFLPYNPALKKVFIVHHKKSNLWIAPGGHIDKGEDLLQTLNRELQEELGWSRPFLELGTPILLTYLDIENDRQSCMQHFDVWIAVSCAASDVIPDLTEFYETRWVTPREAQALVTNSNNLSAIQVLVMKGLI